MCRAPGTFSRALQMPRVRGLPNCLRSAARVSREHFQNVSRALPRASPEHFQSVSRAFSDRTLLEPSQKTLGRVPEPPTKLCRICGFFTCFCASRTARGMPPRNALATTAGDQKFSRFQLPHPHTKNRWNEPETGYSVSDQIEFWSTFDQGVPKLHCSLCEGAGVRISQNF